MRDYRFHCEDCDSYSQCQYYHNRKGTSLICKEFQYGSSVIEQIRDEIAKCLEAINHIKTMPIQLYTPNEIEARKLTYEQCIGFIDKYTKGE